jgi:hypothetical protein
VAELGAADWPPLRDRRRVRDALACPHGLFAPGGSPGRPCRLRRLCPFCHAERVALAYENVLRAARRHPGLGLLLLRRDAPPLKGERGRVRTARCSLAAGAGGAFGGDAGLLKNLDFVLAAPAATPHGIARAVARLFRYDARLLHDPAAEVSGRLLRARGRRSSAVTGVFISPRSATHLRAGLDPAVAPRRAPRLPWHAAAEEEALVAGSGDDFDHAAFVEAAVRARLGPQTATLSWGGRQELTMAGLFRRREPTLRPLLRAWRRGAARVAFATGSRYWVLRDGWAGACADGETVMGVRLRGRHYTLGFLGQWLAERARRPADRLAGA